MPGLQRGKTTVSPLKKQSNSLVHSTAVGKCYWGLFAMETDQPDTKKPKKVGLIFVIYFWKYSLSVKKRASVLLPNSILFVSLLKYIYCHLWLKIPVSELAHALGNLLFFPVWLTELAPHSGNEKSLLGP